MDRQYEPSRLGATRTHIGLRHALIAPDGQVPSSLPGLTKATAVILISREMGARFHSDIVDLSASAVPQIFRPMISRHLPTSCKVQSARRSQGNPIR